MTTLNESVVEAAALAWLEDLGYTTMRATAIDPDAPGAERTAYNQVVLSERLRQALARLNPQLPFDAIEAAFRAVTRPESPLLLANNRAFHHMLVHGVPVEYRRDDGSIAGDRAQLIDFDDPTRNEWLAVNQFTVIAGPQQRRADIVVFVNGLPLALFELKNAAAQATLRQAFNQLQTYRDQIPALFVFNELLVISDSTEARIGTLTSSWERFASWKTVEGEAAAPLAMPQLQVLIRGVFEQRRLLELLRSFIVFEDSGAGVVEKKLAGYHQFHAVERAVEATVAAISPDGSRRCGVVWHTQGSGKSLTMVFYAGKLAIHPALENPTIVVLTDRIDLDSQLFGVFARCAELLRQLPTQAEDSGRLRELLKVASGGIIFTTIQKFIPEDGSLIEPYTERRNVVVIADEAHRSQYGFEAKLDRATGELSYGFAERVRQALPNASFLGFTGTPIALDDRNTRQVFGEYISIYDIQRAVDDHATVPIYYENRSLTLDLDASQRPTIDPRFEEVTEGEEVEHKEILKSRWSQLEKIVGSEARLARVAADLVEHFEQRQTVLAGKAMIVCMSRRICVDLYNAIIQLRPEWHAGADDQGVLKVIMTGSPADQLDWQPHIRSKARREALGLRFRDPATSFKVVIVRDMWLTGFDAPALHTMYIDKPMHGHGLMQAIARVNRVFRDKPSGLVVDYLGLADQLRQAMLAYTESNGTGDVALTQAKAVEQMLAKYEICCDLFHGFDWSPWNAGNPSERVSLLPAAQEYIFGEVTDGVARLNQAVLDLSKEFAQAMPADQALAIRDDVAFFQAVRVAVMKTTAKGQSNIRDDLDHAVRQIVAQAITPGEVIDIFAAAGLPKPNLSILSEEFLRDMRGLAQKNLAVEVLRKLLNDEIRSRERINLVQSRSFATMLEEAIRRYHNRAIETVQVLEELIGLAKQLRAADSLGEATGLSAEELAFYTALELNDSAVQAMGDAALKAIARELTETLRNNVTIDWTVREGVRAKMRVLVKRILRRHGYPPDKQEQATLTVIEQAALLSDRWAV